MNADDKATDLMAALEQSLNDAKAARRAAQETSAALAQRVFDAIASALDDGHSEPENEQDAAVAVVNALYEAGFDIVRRTPPETTT